MEVAWRGVCVNGRPVRYGVAGAGEPVILVHGLAASARWWRRNIPALAARHRVYLVDLPGFGALRRHRPRLVLAQAATWLLDWMEAAGLREAHLVGHSMGGYICLRLAASRPEVVRRLALVAPAGLPAGRSLPGYLPPLLTVVRQAPAPFLPLLVHDALRAGPLALLRAARDLLAEDVRDDLASVAAPTLLVWGERDPLVPPALAAVLRREIANSRLLLLGETGHVPMFERPEEFNAALLAFLAGEAVGE